MFEEVLDTLIDQPVCRFFAISTLLLATVGTILSFTKYEKNKYIFLASLVTAYITHASALLTEIFIYKFRVSEAFIRSMLRVAILVGYVGIMFFTAHVVETSENPPFSG